MFLASRFMAVFLRIMSFSGGDIPPKFGSAADCRREFERAVLANQGRR
jgi:hypothetical protein